jgi:Polyketide cyclase / dehydrase and lipid transport
MKKTSIGLLTILIALFSFSNATAQKTGKKQNVTASVVVNKSASEVWKILAKIDGLEKVIPSMLSETHIEGDGKAKEGCVRYCKSPQGSVTREKVVKLDNKNMFYAYEFVEGVPAKMTNSFKVISLGDNMCKVIWASDYIFMENPMMKEDQLFVFVNMSGQKIVDEVKAFFAM